MKLRYCFLMKNSIEPHLFETEIFYCDLILACEINTFPKKTKQILPNLLNGSVLYMLFIFLIVHMCLVHHECEWVAQTYIVSLQWRIDWCYQQCWWPHSCTVHYHGSGHLEFPDTVHQQWTEFDLPTERDRKGRLSWCSSYKYIQEVHLSALTCTLTSSLYHSISGRGSLSVWHSSVKWPLAGTDTVLMSLEPRRVGGTAKKNKFSVLLFVFLK